MQDTSTELFLSRLKMLLPHFSEFITLGSSERESKSNDLMSSQEDWGKGREKGASLRPDTWTENESANFQCLILKNTAYMPQKGDPWLILPLHLVSHTFFLPEGTLCSLAWTSWQLFCVCWWTSPLLFSLAVNASGNTSSKKLTLLLPLMHLDWAYRILGLPELSV